MATRTRRKTEPEAAPGTTAVTDRDPALLRRIY
jgi:hypothetical protein